MKNITITAHTGCEKTPDNSLESISAGAASGADVVEFDIRFDKNNMPVLSHDEPKGGEVTLEQAFRKLTEYKNLKANIDIKSTANLKEIQRLAEKYNLLDRIFYTGVFEHYVEAVKKDSPKIPYYLNIRDVIKPKKQTQEYLMSLVKKVKDNDAIGINFHYKNASKKLVDAFHDNGLLVSIWTVNRKWNFIRIMKMSPDNITTKKPNLAKKFR